MVEVTEGIPCGVNPRVTWRPGAAGVPAPAAVRPELDEPESVHRALVLGLRDYAAKCGFRTAVLGLSGGIDSALTAALAAEALGPDNVLAVSLPSRYSSPGSLTDSEALVANLGIRYEVLSIEPTFRSLLGTLEPLFAGTPPGAAEENLQARARGMILMALSNKFGHLLLTTGNKSELAVGYCTLYGDMAGGLAVISDVPKTLVYAVSRHLNREREIIPESTLTKPPSAELKPDQTDQDSLPPYEVLDTILEGFIEEGKGVSELVAGGLDRDTVVRVIDLVTRAEYKRRQAAPGIKISPKAFGTGRRMPIASGWPPRR
jgi:NAD+ synthetase